MSAPRTPSAEAREAAGRADRAERWLLVPLLLGGLALAAQAVPEARVLAPWAAAAVVSFGLCLALIVHRAARGGARSSMRHHPADPLPRPDPGYLGGLVHALLYRRPRFADLRADRDGLLIELRGVQAALGARPDEHPLDAAQRLRAEADRQRSSPATLARPEPRQGETRRAYYGRALAHAGFAELVSYLDAPGVLWNGTDAWGAEAKLWEARGTPAQPPGATVA